MGLTGEKLERYLYRDCVLLALAVQARTGWPAVQIFDRDDAGEWIVRHALIRMPDGRLLDAAGPHDDYSGEQPFSFADWEMDGTESLWRELLYDADELLASLMS
jgi:hypothetical protein